MGSERCESTGDWGKQDCTCEGDGGCCPQVITALRAGSRRHTHNSVLINVQGIIGLLFCPKLSASQSNLSWWADIQGLQGVSENWINETAALMQWRNQIITSSHLANQCYSAHIYVNHSQKWIGMTGSLPIYYYYTYSVKSGSGSSSHGSEFSWLNHWVHTAVVTRKQQLISQPPVHSGSILTRLLITLHGKNILIRQVKRDLKEIWFSS